MRVLVFLDGTAADPDTPQIRVDDLGLMRGDGVFETVLVVDGKPRELDAHLTRLRRSAAMLQLPEPDLAQWERVCRQVIDAWRGGSEMALKLVYTRGVEGADEPTGFAYAAPVEESSIRAREDGIAAITLDRGIDPEVVERAPWLLLGAKSLSYGVNMAAVREAARRGAADAIFTSADGGVLEGPRSSVIIARGRTLFTPPATIGILPGTTQAALYRGAEKAGWAVKTERLTVDDLFSAEALLLVSSIRKITRVHTLDDRPLPDSTSVHAELAAAYEAEYA